MFVRTRRIILAGMAGVVATMLIRAGFSPVTALLGAILTGLACGALNGASITLLQIPPFIATLGTLGVARGLAFVLATGAAGTVASNVPMRDAGVAYLGAGYVGPVPVPVLIMLALVVVSAVLLANTVLGRQIYAVGSNPRGARLSGVNVERVQLVTYVVCGGLAAFAGIITTGLLATASTNLGQGVELDVIAAAVIGGTSLRGGEGSVVGTLIGAAIMAVVRNAFVLLGLPLHLQVMIIGVVILLAVGLDRRHR